MFNVPFTYVCAESAATITGAVAAMIPSHHGVIANIIASLLIVFLEGVGS